MRRIETGEDHYLEIIQAKTAALAGELDRGSRLQRAALQARQVLVEPRRRKRLGEQEALGEVATQRPQGLGLGQQALEQGQLRRARRAGARPRRRRGCRSRLTRRSAW